MRGPKKRSRKQKAGSQRGTGSQPSFDHRSSHSQGYDRRKMKGRSLRDGDGDYEGVIAQTHMQHVLSLEERAQGNNRLNKMPETAAPDLRDSPLQKDFLASLEEFERKLIIVTVLSLVIVAIGILGTFLSKSRSL
mmetsp:Transcript_9431/g.11560  ORF Transcript_9431/g.11560 Transcript_9431/m.11560 type:complete len:135 (+) Transcript_9431:393-797(+)